MSDFDIFNDDCKMTPVEHEKSVHCRVTELQNEILKTTAQLSRLYQEYDYWQSTLAEIDIFGAEDYYGYPSSNSKLIARTDNGDYVF